MSLSLLNRPSENLFFMQPSPSPIAPGALIAGKYTIERELAAGGMGKVFTAIQQPVNRRVVLKLMHAELVSNADMRERFLREAEAAGKLQHPNVVTIFDYGTTSEGVCFIAMEYIEGQSLQQLIERKGALPLDQTVQIIIQVANSLAEAHRKNIIHRDLKPDNIMVTTINEGELVAKVLDFGIAKMLDESKKLTAAGTIFGTPSYMAPEQGRGLPLDGRADLYALGCVMFAMLTGDAPFNEETAVAIVMAHITGPIPNLPPHLPEPLNAFSRRVLAKEPKDRPANAETFIKELRAAVEGVRNLNLPPAPVDSTGALSTTSLSTSNNNEATLALSAQSTPSSPSQATIVVQAAPTRPVPWIPIALIAAAVILLVVWMGNRDPSTPPPAAPTPSAPPTTASDADTSPPPVVTPPVAAQSVSLSINSAPPGALIFINDSPTAAGQTPFTYNGKPGDKLRVTLRKTAYADHTTPELTLDPNAPQNQHFVNLKRRRLTLRVSSPLPRSTLLIEGVALGTMLEHKVSSNEISWPEQDLLLAIRSDTHEDFVLKLSPSALEKAVEDGELEWEPQVEDFIPKVTP
jgi:serine/threonine protein kinase